MLSILGTQCDSTLRSILCKIVMIIGTDDRLSWCKHGETPNQPSLSPGASYSSLRLAKNMRRTGKTYRSPLYTWDGKNRSFYSTSGLVYCRYCQPEVLLSDLWGCWLAAGVTWSVYSGLQVSQTLYKPRTNSRTVRNVNSQDGGAHVKIVFWQQSVQSGGQILICWSWYKWYTLMGVPSCDYPTNKQLTVISAVQIPSN